MFLEHCPAIALQTDPKGLGGRTPSATTFRSLACPPMDSKVQQSSEESWPEEARIPCPSLDPTLPQPSPYLPT